MNKEQYEIACEIVSLDCTLTTQMKDGKGNFCVLGGLYTAIDPDWAMRNDGPVGNVGTGEMYLLVGEVFGVDPTLLWQANDGVHNDLDKRRIAVKAALTAQLEEE